MPIIGDNIFVSDRKVDGFDPDRMEEKSLGEYLLNKLMTQHPDEILFIDYDSGRQWTGRELGERILHVATSLLEDYNFQQNSSVCISYNNCDLSVVLGLAVIVAGGTVAAAYVKDPYAELVYQARRIRPKFLFCHQANLKWAEQLEKDLGYHVVAMAMDSEQFMEFIWVKKAKVSDKLPVACKDLTTDVAFITMSSGTTGRPKAVPVTHKNCLTEMKIAATYLQKEFRTCQTPFDYVSGRHAILDTIRHGYSTIILNGFDPKTYLDVVQKYKITTLFIGVGSFYHLITYEHLHRYDLSTVKLIFPFGARIIFLDKLREFLTKYPNIQMMSLCYGTSETSFVSSMLVTSSQFLEMPDCGGKLVPWMQARIVDCDTNRPLGKKERGSLRLKGPTVSPGYYDLSQLERGATSPFVCDTTYYDELGFYITGDLAYFDEDERLFIMGREKELMYTRGSVKVVPGELEEILAEHPAVANACVLGMANEIEPTIHCPRAFVQIRPGCYNGEINLDGDNIATELKHEGHHSLCSLAPDKRRKLAESIMAYVNKRLGWKKHLTGGLVLVDQIPTMRATGKTDKTFLRSLSLQQVEIYGDQTGQYQQP